MAPARPDTHGRLPRGRHALAPDTAAAVYRPRLYSAAVSLMAELGYGAITVERISTQAGVSTATFYELFPNKHALVLAAADTIVDELSEAFSVPVDSATGLHEALTATLRAAASAVAARPEPARLVTGDVLALGPEGLARHRRLGGALAISLRRAASVDGAPTIGPAELSVITGGTLFAFDRHLRSGQLRALRASAPDLARWGAGYATHVPRSLPPRPPTTDTVPSTAPPVREIALPRGRHGLPPSFVRRHQRARIIEAVQVISAEHGFEAASLRDLIGCAGLSHQTFYEHFASKEEAWAAAFDEGFVGLFAAAWYAASGQGDPVAQITAAVDASLAFLEANPAQARLLLVDARSAGRPGGQAIDEAVQAFNRLLTQRSAGPKLPAVVPVALVSGLATMVGEWIVDGRTDQLRSLAPLVLDTIITPFNGGQAPAPRRPAPSTAESSADHRQRLTDAFVVAVARDGFEATNLSDVAQTLGIELDVVSALFRDEVDCATQALDAWGGQLVVIAAGAFLSASGDAPLAAFRALEAALGHIARSPGVTALAVTDSPELTAAISEMTTRFVSLFFQLIAGQVTATDQLPPQPLDVLGIVIDGIMAVVRRYVQERRTEQLPRELHALTQQCLTPFFGVAEARRVLETVAAGAIAR